MYDVAYLVGLSLLGFGALVIVLSRPRAPSPQDEIDRRFDEIVSRLGD